MKKFVALILAVAMIASIAIIPSFAESKASITLDKTEVEINADGSYELNATITGATTYETWLAIYNKAQLEAAGGDYKACGHYGWIYAQNNGRELDKNVIVADGTTVDFGSAKLISTTHGTMLGGEYVARYVSRRRAERI